MQYKFKINGKQYEAEIVADNGSTLDVVLNGNSYTVEMENVRPKARPRVVSDVTAQVAAMQLSPQQNVAPKAAKAKSVKSPLPGVVLDVKVAPGETVKRGQTVMVLEAMKMENNIEATAEGVVASISKSKGDSVMEGDVLIVMQ